MKFYFLFCPDIMKRTRMNIPRRVYALLHKSVGGRVWASDDDPWGSVCAYYAPRHQTSNR